VAPKSLHLGRIDGADHGEARRQHRGVQRECCGRWQQQGHPGGRARIQGAFIASPEAALLLRGKALMASQIGKELGVRYVLQGDVQRSGSKLRIDAHLRGIDKLTSFGRVVRWRDDRPHRAARPRENFHRQQHGP
jgi:hypothetical protein